MAASADERIFDVTAPRDAEEREQGRFDDSLAPPDIVGAWAPVRQVGDPWLLIDTSGAGGTDTGVGEEDHGTDHNKKWLRFPYVATVLRSHYLTCIGPAPRRNIWGRRRISASVLIMEPTVFLWVSAPGRLAWAWYGRPG
jgi:hypothetical protein